MGISKWNQKKWNPYAKDVAIQLTNANACAPTAANLPTANAA